jgi:hypothetical protein
MAMSRDALRRAARPSFDATFIRRIIDPQIAPRVTATNMTERRLADELVARR